MAVQQNMQPYKSPLAQSASPIRPYEQPRAAPVSARSLFRRRSTANSSERATAGAAATTSITTAGGFTRGKAIHRNSHNPTRVR